MKNYRVIAPSGLNIRSGPGPDYEDVGDLPFGMIIQSPDVDPWLPILRPSDDTIYWIAREYTEAAPDEPTAAEEPAPAVVVELAPSPIATVSGEYDFSSREGTIAAIRAECQKQGLALPTQQAYVLATVELETAKTFKPVREAYYISEDFDTAEKWRQEHLRYYPFYGRGFVQLTWEENYRNYSEILGIDFVEDPDKVMEPNISVFILVHGFKHGGFTGKKLEDYVNAERTDFMNARRCINGTDRAQKIAGWAEKYLA